MSSDEALARWIPRLVRLWRRGRGDAPLSPREVRSVARGVERLRAGLTGARSLAGERYLDDPELLGAYLLFYWPISYAQGRSVLGELRARPKSALDLGAGPGPLGFAALDAGVAEVLAIDRSKPALALARELALSGKASLRVRAWSAFGQLPDGTYELILAGHFLNELRGRPASARADLMESAAAKLRPGGSLVIIEPALRETSRELLAVRDVLVERGFAVRAPCLFRGACPALARPSDWCHAERDWAPPELTLEIAKAAGLRKEALKFAYLVLSPKDEPWANPPGGEVYRIVSEPLPGKGRQRLMGCGPTGRMGLALADKNNTPENVVFRELLRGDLVRLEGASSAGDGRALSKESKVQLLAPRGSPTHEIY